MALGSLLERFTGPRRRGTILVGFASQTGAAEAIAWRSANALSGAGFVRVAALGALTAADIAQAGTFLVVTSTYGAGESPDSARAFAREQMKAPSNFPGVRFAVLALGDRKYDATFCQFGRALDRWLGRSKARRLYEPVCVDGDNDRTAMTVWCDHLNRLGAAATVEALMPRPPQDWLLAGRALLNAGSPGGEAWNVALTPVNPVHLAWTAGDIAEVWPANPRSAVDAFLARHELDGARVFCWQGHQMPLAEIIAHSRIPHDYEARGIAVEWLVERLEPYPRREYSIATIPQDGRIDLLVRKVVKTDGTLGLGSGWLTQIAPQGGIVKLRVRPNPNFHPPKSDRVILIGAGTGMAGLMAHLRDRRQKKLRGAWLLFGERQASTDFYYDEDRWAWSSEGCGVLARIDTVFSRSAHAQGETYVQHLVARHGEDVRAAVNQGAAILVCGGLAMAAGVQVALVDILGQEKLDAMTQEGCYRRDVY